MEMTSIQVFVLAQSLVLKIKSPDMELTRNAVAYRNAYKKARGIRKNANALEVLRDLKSVCEGTPFMSNFVSATERHVEIVAQL
jgi:hypothetical protein